MFKSFFNAGYRGANDVDKFLDEQDVYSVGGYGTSTTCVEVMSKESQLILDCGSGMKRLGDAMLSGPASKGKAKVHIFMTHFHWDHVIGLPFFVPIFIPGNELHFYAVQPELEKLIKGLFVRPYFPVPFEALGAKIFFHTLKPRVPIQIDDMKVTPYQLDHPDTCWGYKVESGGKAYAHCVDTEGTRSSRDSLGPDLPLYQGIDLMYYDAQYTLPELAEKINWGHSAAQIGLDIAMREGVKQVLFTHHDPGASTQNIQTLEVQTREYYDWKISHARKLKQSLNEVKWGYAFEEQIVEL